MNRNRALELVEFFEDMYDYDLNSLKEYVERKSEEKWNYHQKANTNSCFGYISTNLKG